MKYLIKETFLTILIVFLVTPTHIVRCTARTVSRWWGLA